MYNRYKDLNKFIIESEKLQIEEDYYVCLSKPEDYDIVAYLGEKAKELEIWKPLLIFLATHIYELDNAVQQRYEKWYHQIFTDDLAVIVIDKIDTIRLTYYGTIENTEYDVVFELKGIETDLEHPLSQAFGRFRIKRFGLKNLPLEEWKKWEEWDR